MHLHFRHFAFQLRDFVARAHSSSSTASLYRKSPLIFREIQLLDLYRPSLCAALSNLWLLSTHMLPLLANLQSYVKCEKSRNPSKHRVAKKFKHRSAVIVMYFVFFPRTSWYLFAANLLPRWRLAKRDLTAEMLKSRPSRFRLSRLDQPAIDSAKYSSDTGKRNAW